MGLFDEITKTIGNQVLGGASQGSLMERVLGLINNPDTGGLGGLINTFKSNGLGDAISSCIGTGQNQPVSGEQIATPDQMFVFD